MLQIIISTFLVVFGLTLYFSAEKLEKFFTKKR
ncbi:MAG: hypothetical protein Ta2A_19420 [Treponemataceae bacterium]|nr:MAG: hypothetical protein Ta2A_19420 [Treponemataceae bacterium]